MKFGEYLRRKALVSVEQLLAALNQQRQARPLIGVLAQEHEFMTMVETMDVLNAQGDDDRLFGEIAIDKGFLDRAQLTMLLQAQQDATPRLGAILVTMGALTEDHLRAAHRPDEHIDAREIVRCARVFAELIADAGSLASAEPTRAKEVAG